MANGTKVIRNLGYQKGDQRLYVTRVEYDNRFYEFPQDQDTTVPELVALYVVSQHGGHGLNVPADPSNPHDAKELEIARLRDNPPPAPVVAEEASERTAPKFVTADPAALTPQPGDPEPAPPPPAPAPPAPEPPAAPPAPEPAPAKPARTPRPAKKKEK